MKKGLCLNIEFEKTETLVLHLLHLQKKFLVPYYFYQGLQDNILENSCCTHTHPLLVLVLYSEKRIKEENSETQRIPQSAWILQPLDTHISKLLKIKSEFFFMNDIHIRDKGEINHA